MVFKLKFDFNVNVNNKPRYFEKIEIFSTRLVKLKTEHTTCEGRSSKRLLVSPPPFFKKQSSKNKKIGVGKSTGVRYLGHEKKCAQYSI